MKKLLVLALLGLILGAGAWKSQNPEGTVDDVRAQATDVLNRLKAGAMTVRESSSMMQSASVKSSPDLTSLQERLAVVEESLAGSIADSPADSTATPEASGNATPAIDGLASSLKDALASTEANMVRLDAVDSRLELLVRRLDEQGVEKRLGDIQTSIDAIGEEVADIRSTNAAQEAALSNEVAVAREQATALGLRVDTLAASRNIAYDGSEPVNAESDGSNAGSASTADSLTASLDERFKALESRLENVNSDTRQIETLNEQLSEATTRISQLQQENAATRRALDQVNGSLAELKTAGESLSIDTVQAEIRDQLALLQSQFETSVETDNAAALQNLLNSTRTRVEDLEARVRDLPAASAEATSAQDTQTALESQIVSLERRLEDISSADPEIASTLSNVQEKVQEIESRGYVTQEDLRTQKEQRAVQYKIYFDRNSVEITEAAAAVLDSFIAQEKNRTTGVSIFGFTDRLGSATYNQQLALQRATNVRSYLIQNGLDYSKIKAMSGLGEDAAAAVLPDNAGDAQQRVVVLFAAQP